jgi:hypothetical protein
MSSFDRSTISVAAESCELTTMGDSCELTTIGDSAATEGVEQNGLIGELSRSI